MVSIRVWVWVIMVIFRWGHSDWGHFNLAKVWILGRDISGLFTDYGLNILGGEVEGEGAIMSGLGLVLKARKLRPWPCGSRPWPWP